MISTSPVNDLRHLALVLVASLPYVDAITDPLYDETNRLTGQALLAIGVVVASALTVIHLSRPVSYGIHTLTKLFPLGPLFLFGFVYWLSYCANPSEEGAARCIKLTCMVIPGCFAFLALLESSADITWALRFILGAGIFLSLISLVFGTHTPFIFLSHGYDLSGMHRGHGRYIEYGTLASTAAIIALVQSCEMDRDANPKWRLFYLAAIPIAAAGTFISGERAGLLLLGFLVVLYAAHVVLAPRNWPQFLPRLGALSILVGGGVVVVILAANLAASAFSREHWESQRAIEDRFDYREGMYARPFYEDLAKNPVLGVGPANYFRRYGYKTNVSNYPHNMFLEVGGEMGVVGLFVYAIILFRFAQGVRVACLMKSNRPLYLCGIAVGVVVLLRTFKQGSIPRSVQFWLYWSYFSWLAGQTVSHLASRHTPRFEKLTAQSSPHPTEESLAIEC